MEDKTNELSKCCGGIKKEREYYGKKGVKTIFPFCSICGQRFYPANNMTNIEKIIEEFDYKFGEDLIKLLTEQSKETASVITYRLLKDFVIKAYQTGREEVLQKAKKLHYEYLKGIKVRETLPAKLAEIYTLGIDDYYHFLSSKE